MFNFIHVANEFNIALMSKCMIPEVDVFAGGSPGKKINQNVTLIKVSL